MVEGEGKLFWYLHEARQAHKGAAQEQGTVCIESVPYLAEVNFMQQCTKDIT